MGDPTEADGRREPGYEDVLRAPPTKVAEILAGELHLSPRPSILHANAASGVGEDLRSSFHRRPGGPHGPGGWWILIEPELHLGRDILVPDIAGWRRDRLSALPDEAFFTLAPDWVCEVLSPRTASLDRVKKLRIYARELVRHVWLVDAAARTVEVLRLESDHWGLIQTVAGSAPARLQPFDAVEVDLERWWGETPDPTDAG